MVSRQESHGHGSRQPRRRTWRSQVADAARSEGDGHRSERAV
ncbi:MAG: hypothetical protein WC483_05030 [Candidatus Paceibacterota bacterium]